MQRKYFEMYGIMDRENLRSNVFFHSCIIFLYANCDEEGNIVLPFYLTDSYSFYSHPLPYKKSFFEEPLAFLTQKVEPNFRFRGNFGEWKRENVHDLTFGRGLTGRLFEKDLSQIKDDKAHIESLIEKQAQFLSQADNLIDQEEMYRNYERQEFLKLVKSGVNPEEARKRTKGLKPLPEFNSFPLTGGAYSCKSATLSVVARGYDARDQDQKVILDYINYLRYGSLNDNYLFMFPRFLTSFIPRLTPDLDEVIFHCPSDRWVARGEKNKYPFCDWKDIHDGDIYAITPGGWYVDRRGYMQSIITPDLTTKKIIKDLKTVGRLCELNLTVQLVSEWHKKINHYLYNLATCCNTHQQATRTKFATRYLEQLVQSKEFSAVFNERVPVNLRTLFDDLCSGYQVAIKSESDSELDARPAYSF